MGLIPSLTQWVKDLALLRLWCSLAATVPIQPLAWELSFAVGVALKSQKKKKSIFYHNKKDLKKISKMFYFDDKYHLSD